MSSCNCMLSGREIAVTNTGTKVRDDHAKWHNMFHQETRSLANAILVFQVDCRGPLCLL